MHLSQISNNSKQHDIQQGTQTLNIPRLSSKPLSGSGQKLVRRMSEFRCKHISLSQSNIACIGSVSSPFSESQLGDVKSSFEAIDLLWKDISLGADSISMSLLSSVHNHLGEIGSELFDQIFLKDVSKNEVFFKHWSLNILTDLSGI